MANEKHVDLLKQGVDAWNKWRNENPDVRPDLRWAKLKGVNLSGATLAGTNLRGADLAGADLTGADLTRANLIKADLAEADLARANLSETYLAGAHLAGAHLARAHLTRAILAGADLTRARLTGATLTRANLAQANLAEANLADADLTGANLTGARFIGAYLIGADLTGASFIQVDLTDADITGCRIYGISAWELKLERAEQRNLIITRDDEPEITVDNIEVAQFVYLMLHNEKIRDVIDTIGKKGVLLLGRFTEGRLEILEKLREKLRNLGFVPMVFNFDKPETKDFTETVRLLAGMSHFVIVDITNPRSAPLELQATVPDYMVPFAPILQDGEPPFAMFVDLQNKYDWVLKPVIGYSSVDRLIEVLEEKIVRRAEAKFNELLARRTQQLHVESIG